MTVLTTVGAARIAAATAETPLAIDRMAVGDGNGAAVTPTVGMTTLVHERARVSVIDKVVTGSVNRIRALFVPGATAYTIREAGLIATNGDLIAVISLPPQEMPTAAWATANSQVIEVTVTIALVVSDAGLVTVVVDTSTVYATIAYVDAKVPPFASITETRDGSTSTKIVHPVGYKTVLDEHKASRSQHPTGTEALQGFLRLSTGPETVAGLLDSVGVSPKNLKAVIDALKGGVAAGGDTLKELYDLIVTLQTVDSNILTILNSVASFANMPIYPEIRHPSHPKEDYIGYRIVPTQSGSTITIPTGIFIIHRGGKVYSTSDFSLTNRQFTIPSAGMFHLRWYAPGHSNAPVNTWPSGRFMLQSMANPGYYVIGGGPNTDDNIAYDSDYDNMYVAQIQAIDIPSNLSIKPLINKASHIWTREDGGSPNNGTKRTDIQTLNLARTPRVSLTPWKFVQPTLGSATNSGVLETDWVNRYGFQTSYELKGATELYWKSLAIMGDHGYDPAAAHA